MIVVWHFLAMPWVSLPFVIVVFPDHTHLLFIMMILQVIKLMALSSDEFILPFSMTSNKNINMKQI